MGRLGATLFWMISALPKTLTVAGEFESHTRLVRIKIPGDIKSTTVSDLQRDIFAILNDPGVRGLPFDTVEFVATEAKMFDSLGLNLIVALLKAVKQRDEKMRLRVASRAVYMTCLAVSLERQLELIYEGPA